MEVKVANFGVERIRMNSKIAKNRLYSPDNESELQYYTLWSAPELLREVLKGPQFGNFSVQPLQNL